MQKNKFIENKTLALMACKCPRCQSGDMFQTKATNLNGFTKMNEFCPVCEVRFEIEPGFFWGAMYVSYSITTAFMLVTCGILLWGFNDPEFWVYVVSIIGIVLLTLPWVFRYSRVLLLYFISPLKFDRTFVKN
ncbi:MAG: DUF983 domain-containing protein [Bacteroidia bacterium]|nr:DUF983 domain-containing protein [Bacteroidia bacterium]